MKTNYLRKWLWGRYPLTGQVLHADKNANGDNGFVVAVYGKAHREFWLNSDTEPLQPDASLLADIQRWLRSLKSSGLSPETLPLR